jgi:hypothetical protein
VISSVDLTAAPVIGGICALGVLALAAIWFVPRRQARGWAARGIAGKELAELENTARGTIVQAVGGVALILTFVATWMQISDARESTDRTLRLTAAQQETERFTRAVEQLDSSQPAIRIGGVYGLADVAAESPKRRTPIAHILLAYLQQRHGASRDNARRVVSERRKQVAARDYGVERDPLVSACGSPGTRNSDDDMQAGLGVIVGLARWARPRLKLSRLDLQYFRGLGADFRSADLTFSYLTGASLVRARFDRAILSGTDFTHACLRGASFDGARGRIGQQVVDAADVRAVGSTGLFRAGLSFAYADLRGASLRNADFAFADLRRADLRGADLRGADLHEANVSGTGLRNENPQRSGARIDACTRLPRRAAVPNSCPNPPG